MKTRAHLIISGRVQGVFFRAFTKQHADRIGVKGWVRNLTNGNVEAVFEGEEEGVKELVNYSSRGPPRAIVRNVQVAYESFRDEFTDFVAE